MNTKVTLKHKQGLKASTVLQQMKGKPCVITDYTKYLELEMTTVIANHCEINEWTKNVKFTLKYTECLKYKLFMIIKTNYYNIWSHLVPGGHKNSLETTQYALKQM